MNAMYHKRFFSDITFTTLAVLAMLIAGAAIDRWLFLTIPFLALMGATSTAFAASYLIFSRQYAARLEQYINDTLDRQVLIAHELEDAYLFPLDQPKIVTLALGDGFTWFGFMTIFYTVSGIVAFIVGLGLSLDVLANSGRADWGFAYLATLATMTLSALIAGGWWFVTGVGEKRLRTILDRHFPSSAP